MAKFLLRVQMASAAVNGPSPRRVFISYARKDGAADAQALRYTLEEASHDVWLDTARIAGGASWSREIESALNACDVLVAVMTPASYLSEICRAEHIWALDEGKIVIPIVTADAKLVPLYLKGRQYRRFPGEIADLLKDICAEPVLLPKNDPRRLFYDTIPSLPQNHVSRDLAIADLRDMVFAEGAGGNIAVTALAGMGGIGKTVLATELCRNAAVQRAFPDGIAWITIGREWDGDLGTRMREVARALGDDLGGYDNPLACENRYRTILREKAALVVVDDVWSVEHLRPLLVDSPRSRFLFTTRDASIAKAQADRRYSAKLLTDSEARDLLCRWSHANPLPPEATEVIGECGGLAGAIAQIGAVLSDVSLAEWRDVLNALKHADISTIEERLPPGQKSFFKSLAVSFQALPENMRLRYLRLAILLDDVLVPLSALQTLWNVNEAEARRTARSFVDRSLAFWEDVVDPSRGLRLHDLQVDYVRASFKDQGILDLIHDALRLSAHVVAEHPEEFASQMIGRLLLHAESSVVGEFIAGIAAGTLAAWLRPLWPALHPPGTALVRTLAGHSASVNAVTLTADGKRIVSASADTTLKVWDMSTGRELRALIGHSAAVSDVALSEDGRLAVSASNDKTLKIWDVETGSELRTLVGHSAPVNGVALTADGKLAISASDDKSLKVWDVETGSELRTIVGHSRPVYSVALSASARVSVSASGDKTLKVWDVESGYQVRNLTGHAAGVTAVALTEDGKMAASASWDTTLKIWDVENGRERCMIEGHSAAVTAVALTVDGLRGVSASRDKTLKLWTVGEGTEVRTLAGHTDWVRSVSLSRDGRRAVSASKDNTLKVWDLESRRAVSALTAHTNSVRGVALSADGRIAVSASWDKTVKVWDVDSGHPLRCLEGHTSAVYSAALSANARLVVSASADGTLRVWEVETGSEVRTLAGHSKAVYSVALTANGKRAVSASGDETLKVWDVESGQAECSLEGHTSAVYAVALSDDGKMAVSASWDKTLKVWDVERGRLLQTMIGHSSYVNGVALTADGRRVVSASVDKTLKFWEVESGRELQTLQGHSSYVNGVALTADGKRAVSASWDKTVKVWEVQSGACIATFHCEGGAYCLTFVDENRILAGDSGGHLYLLSLEGLEHLHEKSGS